MGRLHRPDQRPDIPETATGAVSNGDAGGDRGDPGHDRFDPAPRACAQGVRTMGRVSCGQGEHRAAARRVLHGGPWVPGEPLRAGGGPWRRWSPR